MPVMTLKTLQKPKKQSRPPFFTGGVAAVGSSASPTPAVPVVSASFFVVREGGVTAGLGQ